MWEQELEAIVVRLEPVLKTRFLPWLQPGPPEEADRRDKTARGAHFFYVAHHRPPWCPRGGVQKEQREFQGPLCTKAVARGPHKKSVPPRALFIAPIGLLRRAWLQPRQKARLQNRFQSNNNRFKLLLPQPSLLQLRLAILTIEGCEECSQDTLLLQ